MLFAAAILLILLCLFHSILGERVILHRMKDSAGLPKLWGSRRATFRTIQVSWHLVSALWLGLALTLILLAISPDRLATGLLVIFGVIFGILTIVPLVWESGKHKSWIAFGLITICLLGQAYLLNAA